MAKKQSVSLRQKDPYLANELERYGTPIPSREYILQILKEQGVPRTTKQLINLFKIKKDELEFFERRLKAMERDGELIRNRKDAWCIVEKLPLIKGKVQAHGDGFGFLIPDEGGEDLYLPPKEMVGVFEHDHVIVREVAPDRRGRREARIVKILERGRSKLAGRIHRIHGVDYLVTEDRRAVRDIPIAREESMGAEPGDVVVAELLEPSQIHGQPFVRVVEILGKYGDPGMEIEIALRKHQLPYKFPADVEKASETFPPQVNKKDYKDREDIRHLPLVTIDGETAKDFDDAVYCTREGKNYRLYVAIADVSHYVTPHDVLDEEALKRGNSVYFPRRVIPMLPEALSNNLCSLNPDVDRLCMVCEMDIDTRGKISKYRFYRAVMCSHARLTYTSVWDMLNNESYNKESAHNNLLPHIELLYELFKVLKQAREKRGAIDFETIETQMIFNENGKIERIVPVKRNDAHRLIEECMLAANVCASDFLQQHKHPTLYRIHEGPTPEKLDALRDFLKGFGLHLGGGDKPSAKDYAKLLAQIKGKTHAPLLQTVMLRSLQQAVYSPDNVGHFGLAYESYTHFTSPIRRYPDLLVHRAINAVLEGAKYKPGDWVTLGEHCSMTERRADEATRDVEAWLKCFFMQDKINECFDGTITGVTGFGIFVTLEDVYIEGLVHISELGDDYFQYDAKQHVIIGERSGCRFRLGDEVRVKVVRVDLERTRIDFVLEEDEVPSKRKKSVKSGKRAH